MVKNVQLFDIFVLKVFKKRKFDFKKTPMQRVLNPLLQFRS